VLRGYGVFDFLRTYGGRPFHLRDHLERLRHSADQIGLRCPWSVSALAEIVEQTLLRNSHPESNIRIVITGGPSEDFITPGTTPRLLVMVSRLIVMPAEWYTGGIKIITASLERLMPGAKSIDYIPAILALRRAAEENAVEAVYLDGRNHVLEGTTCNLFMFGDGKFITPDRGVLSGITRKVVLGLVESRFPLERRDISLTELLAAEEIFLCSSNKEVAPVVKVDKTVIGDGKPGPNTGKVMSLFAEYTRAWASGSTPKD
jgi:branched-chain amino acid aminotransferase